MRPRPMRNEVLIRERHSFPSPPKKTRVDSYGPYPEPERRPMIKPAQKIAGPRAANAVVIEKKPMLFNASPRDVSDFPPLPERVKSMQKQPVRTFEKQDPIKPIQKQPVRITEKQEPMKPIQKQPVRITEKQLPVKPIQKQGVKIIEKQEPIKPIQKQPAKTVEKQDPIKSVQKQPVKTVEKQEPIKPIQKQAVKTVAKHDPIKPTEKQPVRIIEKQEAIKPISKQPVKTVEKQEPMQPTQKQQVKPVDKQEPIQPTQKQPVRTAEQQKTIQKQAAKPLIQNQETPVTADKKEAKPVAKPNTAPHAASTEPSTVGSELDPLLSRALSDELQLIMDQISQMLPETAQSDAERLVVNKFRTDVGDDIKNALGLNVTSRLLNRHHPFYVKLLFSGKPEAGSLQAFISKYSISAFKRIESPLDTFAARLDSFSDFDRLCEAKEINCGSAKVAVTPCYKFLNCPPNLKSIYATGTAKQDTASNSSPQKKLDSVKPKDTVAKTTVDQKATGRDDSQKVTVNKDDTQKITVTHKIETATDVSDEKAVNKTVTPVKNANTAAASTVKVNITIEGESKPVDVKNTVSKEINKIETKTEPAKEVNKSGTNKKPESKKETPDVTANKTSNKVTNLSIVANKSQKQTANNTNEDTMVDEPDINDNEELTDHDILAMMSGGIVLDECSGSDDE